MDINEGQVKDDQKVSADAEMLVLSDIEIIVEDLLVNSNYVSPKPDTTMSPILGDAVEEIQNLDVSPLNVTMLPSAQSFQLFNLVGSTYSGQSISGAIENFGTYIFDSVLSGLNAGASNYMFQNTTSVYSAGFTSNFFNSNQTILPVVIEGGSQNDVLIGNSKDNIIRGNSVSASPPLSASIIIDNPTLDGTDFFGSSMAQVGDLLLVGAHREDTGASETGTVYLYDISDGTLLRTFNNPTAQAQGEFGRNVSMNENYILINAPGDDTGASKSGVSYIYDVSTGALLHTLVNPIPSVNDRFGYFSAIDDNYTVITSPFDNGVSNVSNMGTMHIYDTATGALLRTIENPEPGINDLFGLNVALEGDYIAVGARDDDAGAVDAGTVYIYSASTGTLLHTINNPTPEVGDTFGRRVDIDGTNLIIAARDDNTGADSAGTAYIYDITTGTLLQTINNPTPAVDDKFAEEVDISGDYAVITAEESDTGAVDAGAVYLYQVSTGKLLFTLNNPSPETLDRFGWEASIDGNRLTVASQLDENGGADAGAIYTYIINFDDADTLYGGTGNDTLYGLEGADILHGGAGADILFGGANSDRFVFEGATTFDGVDRIEDFNVGEEDVLDISDVLVGYDPLTDSISDFARFVDNGADTVLEVDIDGTVGGVNFQAVALIVGGAGLDSTTLEASGQLDAII